MNDDVRPRRPAWRSAPHYRTVGEAQIADMLLHQAWVFEAASGESERWRPEAFERIDRLVGLGLPFRATPDGRAFDPAEVINFVKWLSLNDEDSFWIDRCVATGQRLAGQFRSGPGLPDALETRRFTFALRRTFNLAMLDRSKPVRFRLPLPIEDGSLRDLVIDGVKAGSLDWRVAPDRSRIDVRGDLPAGQTLSLAMQLSFTTANGSDHATGDGWTRYLHPSEGHIQVTPRVRRLADHLAGPITAPREVIARFWDFMIDHLICGVLHYDQVAAAETSGDWVLDTGVYDCQLGSCFLAALCRARGLPARVVGGYLIYSAAAAYHFWTEVWLGDEGWVPFDLLVWDLSAGGRDRPWRSHFAGVIEPRMKTQCLPLRFVGFVGAAFPAAWHMLGRRSPCATESIYQCVDTGARFYGDEIDVRCHDGAAAPALETS